ncbi:MAG: hypothetical protein DWQ44_13265 [Bacteroidetes bacterium]|nr:MAG: hypothetical protein DWQ33_13650 [Bacteroidota bacterium]REK05765.1 MAG: hypothetical protein DWQ39_04985 [Bacteroidota bacterium]REK31929.1 MAG: hypothetical protein DWQ44_13265 [Bacteroidota bacterium]REK49994.1 MAG: hypothetical protein DWQ48_05485 [Bacteroidota bacterium]
MTEGMRYSIVLIASLFLFSCGGKKERKSLVQKKKFDIVHFSALTNWGQQNQKDKTIEFDYTDAILHGFVMPSIRQVQDGKFTFEFSVSNKSDSAAKFHYKIYYQNESYKFHELDSISGREHEFANENFYGSWLDTGIGFRETELIQPGKNVNITDSFQIAGNPRNEQICFKDGVNQRWKRNPRTGEYRFMLVVISDAAYKSKLIPEYISNISLTVNGRFQNPFYFFKYGAGSKSSEIAVVHAEERLMASARPDPGAGMFYNPYHFDYRMKRIKTEYLCDTDSQAYKNAAFEQFVHHIDYSTNLENIPVIADVSGSNYTRRDYNWNRSFYRREELISTPPNAPMYPCETVVSDPVRKVITIRNPGVTYGNWKKENVGIITRHGLAYGKYRMKCKLTRQLNDHNVWNGITNAIWMIYQSGEDWNLRRACRKEGYMENYYGGRNDNRVSRVGYSEIDFEILKTPDYCPDQYFPPVYKNPAPNRFNQSSWNVPWPQDIMDTDDKLSVSCTNWDMACWEPSKYGVGCNPISYQGQVFNSHRWDHWYRAITQKKQVSDKEMFGGPYYYFEIDWRPEEIIWRIGPEPDQMFIVGYMNKDITSIPNNQMLMIVTQEFHNTQWWPGSPYHQQYIPFPEKDLVGEIYELVIE